MTEHDYREGFKLLETMIVLVFIGILAGCTEPISSGSPLEIRQREAKLILQQIYEMEQAYFQKHDLYWPVGAHATDQALSNIAITIPSFAKYTYTVAADYTTFIASAISTVLDDDATLDYWHITQEGKLEVVIDDAAD